MTSSASCRLFGWFGVLWAVVGVSLLLGNPVYRLGKRALDSFDLAWTPIHWIALAVCLIFMGYSEGYKGFQKAFSPRAASRTRYLRDNPTVLRVVLAPFFVMCFFGATKKRLIVSWVLLLTIIGLILLVQQLPADKPWRGIIDAGVVFGLSWGLITFWAYLIPALTRATFDVPPELNEPVPAPTGG